MVMAKSQEDWEAESAADTLMRAEEVKRKPALHKKAMVILEARQKALAAVTTERESDGATVRAKRRGQPAKRTPGIVGG